MKTKKNKQKKIERMDCYVWFVFVSSPLDVLGKRLIVATAAVAPLAISTVTGAVLLLPLIVIVIVTVRL